MFVYRYYYTGHGQFDIEQKFPMEAKVNFSSLVVCSICEIRPLLKPEDIKVPYIHSGSASMSILNVCPGHDDIRVRVNIDQNFNTDFQIVFFIKKGGEF
jgi:hypothetical protein